MPRTATASAAANASHRRRHFSASAARAENTAPPPPSSDKASTDTAYLGTKKRLPEFSLKDKVVLVSGGARGLGLTQTEALLEAGATGESCSALLSFRPDIPAATQLLEPAFTLVFFSPEHCLRGEQA